MAKITSQDIINNKNYIYSTLFFISGIICSTIIYKTNSEKLIKVIKSVISSSSEFKTTFINYISIYLLIFTITLLLGICLYGYPVINIIPLIIGIEQGTKINYLYNVYHIKGVVYALLVIIPECAAFITILSYTISNSINLSKNICAALNKKTDTQSKIMLNEYLKKYIILFAFTILIAAVNALISYMLKSIITI